MHGSGQKPRFIQLQQLDNRYALPSQNYFMYTEIPALCNETKYLIMENLGGNPCTTVTAIHIRILEDAELVFGLD